MARWKRGEAEVEGLVTAGDLHKLTGEAANGARLLERAATTLETARSAIGRDPDSPEAVEDAAAIIDAARGLRAQLGLF